MGYLDNAELWFIAMKKFDHGGITTRSNFEYIFRKCTICDWKKYSSCYIRGTDGNIAVSICNSCIKLHPTDPKVQKAYELELIRLTRELIK